MASDEAADIARLKQRLGPDIQVRLGENATLFEASALPFSLNELPETYSAFRRRVEKHASSNEAIPAPITLPLWPEGMVRGIPPLGEICPEAAAWKADSRGMFHFTGGEVAGMARLDAYLWDGEGSNHYKQTRNGLMGADFSTRFSTWLARGCLSPPQVIPDAWQGYLADTD